MSPNGSNLDDNELLTLLLEKINNSSEPSQREISELKDEFKKLDIAYDKQNTRLEHTEYDIENLKRDVQAAKDNLAKIQAEFDSEVDRLDDKINEASNSRGKFTEWGLMLILGALVPALFNIMFK